jgi:hypothetical protein
MLPYHIITNIFPRLVLKIQCSIFNPNSNEEIPCQFYDEFIQKNVKCISLNSVESKYSVTDSVG